MNPAEKTAALLGMVELVAAIGIGSLNGQMLSAFWKAALIGFTIRVIGNYSGLAELAPGSGYDFSSQAVMMGVMMCVWGIAGLVGYGAKLVFIRA